MYFLSRISSGRKWVRGGRRQRLVVGKPSFSSSSSSSPSYPPPSISISPTLLPLVHVPCHHHFWSLSCVWDLLSFFLCHIYHTFPPPFWEGAFTLFLSFFQRKIPSQRGRTHIFSPMKPTRGALKLVTVFCRTNVVFSFWHLRKSLGQLVERVQRIIDESRLIIQKSFDFWVKFLCKSLGQ